MGIFKTSRQREAESAHGLWTDQTEELEDQHYDENGREVGDVFEGVSDCDVDTGNLGDFSSYFASKEALGLSGVGPKTSSGDAGDETDVCQEAPLSLPFQLTENFELPPMVTYFRKFCLQCLREHGMDHERGATYNFYSASFKDKQSLHYEERAESLLVHGVQTAILEVFKSAFHYDRADDDDLIKDVRTILT